MQNERNDIELARETRSRKQIIVAIFSRALTQAVAAIRSSLVEGTVIQ